MMSVDIVTGTRTENMSAIHMVEQGPTYGNLELAKGDIDHWGCILDPILEKGRS